MNRKWYKVVNGIREEAPETKEINGKIMYNYNCEANSKMLLADGYLPSYDKD